jgi:DNA-binding SARP family transcriptional activator
MGRLSYGAETLRLCLLGGWALLRGGEPISIAPAGQRVVALLALQRRQSRARIAGTLWPETYEGQALASLRSTLWRLQLRLPRLLSRSGGELELNPELHIDAHEMASTAHRLLAYHPIPEQHTRPDDLKTLTLSGKLLPGWHDDWVMVERERLHQLRLHALEALAENLVTSRRYAQALEVALAAVAAEPMRESANRLVIQIHLFEDNPTEAMRHFDRYRELLRDELGIPPSAAIRDLVAPYRQVQLQGSLN